MSAINRRGAARQRVGQGRRRRQGRANARRSSQRSSLISGLPDDAAAAPMRGKARASPPLDGPATQTDTVPGLLPAWQWLTDPLPLNPSSDSEQLRSQARVGRRHHYAAAALQARLRARARAPSDDSTARGRRLSLLPSPPGLLLLSRTPSSPPHKHLATALMSTSHPSYHVSTPSGSSSRPPAVDRPFVPPSSPRASASRSLISPLPSAQDPQRADRQTPKGASIIHEDDDCVAYLERDRALASAGASSSLVDRLDLELTEASAPGRLVPLTDRRARPWSSQLLQATSRSSSRPRYRPSTTSIRPRCRYLSACSPSPEHSSIGTRSPSRRLPSPHAEARETGSARRRARWSRHCPSHRVRRLWRCRRRQASRRGRLAAGRGFKSGLASSSRPSVRQPLHTSACAKPSTLTLTACLDQRTR